jgi:hypothetical protein
MHFTLAIRKGKPSGVPSEPPRAATALPKARSEVRKTERLIHSFNYHRNFPPQKPVYPSRRAAITAAKEHQMKRILLAEPLALVLSGALAFAQTTTQPSTQPDSSAAPIHKGYRHAGRHGHDPQQEAAMLSKRLNLTSDQQAKLEPILADRDQKVTALMSDTSLTQDQKKAQFKAIHQDMKQQLSSILTPEQLQQMHSAARHHGRHSQSQQPQALPQSGPPSGA